VVRQRQLELSISQQKAELAKLSAEIGEMNADIEEDRKIGEAISAAPTRIREFKAVSKLWDDTMQLNGKPIPLNFGSIGDVVKWLNSEKVRLEQENVALKAQLEGK